MRNSILLALVGLGLAALPAAAQDMSPGDRAVGAQRARELARCLSAQSAEMLRVTSLLDAAERQRDTAPDPAARRDAEAAIEALLVRIASVQRDTAECLRITVPGPRPTTVVVEPPADPAADAVAGTGGSLPAIEREARLSEYIVVVLAQQVDGRGRLDAGAVRGAFRGAVPGLERCYEQHLGRGSIQAGTLDLVFWLRGAGPAREVTIESSRFSDPELERCVRAAAQNIRTAAAPRGGGAQFSYRLRFGRS